MVFIERFPFKVLQDCSSNSCLYHFIFCVHQNKFKILEASPRDSRNFVLDGFGVDFSSVKEDLYQT